MPLVPQAGGTERITSLVAKGLTKLGHNCLGILELRETSSDITYCGEKIKNLSQFLFDNKIDIVINQIAYSTWLLKAFLQNGGDVWRSRGGRIISCLHFDPKPTSDLYYMRSIRDKRLRDYANIAKSAILYSFYKKRQERNTGAIFNWVYDNSDWFITLSERHFPYFKKVTRREDFSRLKAINNPLTFDDISAPSIIDEKRNVILVCSRMDEYQKRISLVLKAWKKLQSMTESKGWTLKILGTGPDFDRYREYARRKKLSNIQFEGRQSPEPYYREADIFLMTSTGIEGWGLTLTESLQRGVVPVVMNTCSVYSDIITDGYNGFLSPGNSLQSFINRIRILISDQRRLRAMQNNALNSATRFTLAKTMEKWQEII